MVVHFPCVLKKAKSYRHWFFLYRNSPIGRMRTLTAMLVLRTTAILVEEVIGLMMMMIWNSTLMRITMTHRTFLTLKMILMMRMTFSKPSASF